MPRYVAFLRGVSPMNLKMADLKRCLGKAGFTDVKTVLSSGNAVFTSPKKSTAALERQIEAAMAKHLDQVFYPHVRSVDELQALLGQDPYVKFAVPPGAKRVVTFARKFNLKGKSLPVERAGAQLLTVIGREAFAAYVPGPDGPVFMALIKETFGSDVTTRTWDTVKKCANA